MKTDPKNSNASRAQSHPELTATDNNPRRLFEVIVSRTDYLYTRVRVEAETESAAEEAAKEAAKAAAKAAEQVAKEVTQAAA